MKVMLNIPKIAYIISILASFWAVWSFWPDYEKNEFPLFTDLTVIFFFLPAFFILFFSFPSFVLLYRFKPQKAAIRIGLVLLVYVLALIFSLSVLEFSIPYRILVSVVASSAGLLHFILSVTYQKLRRTWIMDQI